MNRIRTAVPTVLLLVATVAGCTDPTDIGQGPILSAAKAPTGPSVQAADPAYGHDGETGKVVTITGSGFDAGSVASWERNGAPDPKITVVSTEFVSSSLLRATVDISTEAVITFYDIAVITSKGRKGIGTELFEVTQATAIDGTFILRGVNENGLLGVGLGFPAYWSQATGMVLLPDLPPDGAGVWSIDEAGVTMSGHEGGDIGVIPVWSLVGGLWEESALPDDPAATGGRGVAIASDPVSGEAVYIGGLETVLVTSKGKKVSVSMPRLWRRGVAGWERIVLPSLATDGGGAVEDVTPDGVVVGSSNGRAVIWERDGTGTWSVQYLPGAELAAKGVNSAGTLAGGGNGAYWQREVGGSWTIHFLPCGSVKGVDDLGRIFVGGCPISPNASRPAIFSPPYTDPPIYLGSLGTKSSSVNLEKVSLRGSWIVGQLAGAPNTVGVYWKVF